MLSFFAKNIAETYFFLEKKPVAMLSIFGQEMFKTSCNDMKYTRSFESLMMV